MEENQNNQLTVKNFTEMEKKSNSEVEVYTTIDDQKKIFNLDGSCDFKINDCKGEKIRVTDVLIKRILKPMKEPIVDEETGEVLKDKELKIITILIDENEQSYVTASKMFGLKMINYIEMFGLQTITDEGLEIKITERAVKNSPNKALSFELV